MKVVVFEQRFGITINDETSKRWRPIVEIYLTYLRCVVTWEDYDIDRQSKKYFSNFTFAPGKTF